MGFLDTVVAEQSKKAVKGAFNIAAMEFILAEGVVNRNQLLKLNLTMRLDGEFGAENVDVDNDMAQQKFIGDVMKTAKGQVDAYITNTTNHRSFNGWAKKNGIAYTMVWNTGKTEIKLEANEPTEEV